MTDDLHALQTELTEACIDALMRTTGQYIRSGSCGEGRFHYYNTLAYAGQEQYHFYVTYPGGEWRQEGNDHAAPFEPYDVRGTYAEVGEAVRSWVAPFLDMPEAADFDGTIGLLQKVAKGLAAGGTVELTGSGSDTKIEVGDPALNVYVQGIQSELADLNGKAMKALRDYYGNRIRNTLSGQHALVVVAGTLVAGEKEAWRRVREDVTKLLNEAVGAFKQLARGDDAGWDALISVLGTVASAAGLFNIPLGVAGTAIDKITTADGLVNSFMPATPDPQEFSVKGDTFDAMWESFTGSLRKLDGDLTTTENAFAQCAINAEQAYAGQPASFNLATPGVFLDSTKRKDEVYLTDAGGRDDVVKVNDALKYVASRFELIGEHQTEMAGLLGGGFENDVTVGPVLGSRGRVWERGGWDLPLGCTVEGHYPWYADLLQGIVNLLNEEAAEAHDVAAKCLKVLSDFRATDAQVEASLHQQSVRVEREVAASI